MSSTRKSRFRHLLFLDLSSQNQMLFLVTEGRPANSHAVSFRGELQEAWLSLVPLMKWERHVKFRYINQKPAFYLLLGLIDYNQERNYWLNTWKSRIRWSRSDFKRLNYIVKRKLNLRYIITCPSLQKLAVDFFKSNYSLHLWSLLFLQSKKKSQIILSIQRPWPMMFVYEVILA